MLTETNDIILLTFLASGFAKFANDSVRAALDPHSLPESTKDPIQVLNTFELPPQVFEAVTWRIDSVLAWQQLERRIDE